MKARVLRKILDDTKYIIHETQDHICIGAAYVSELISIRKDTLQMRYALDTFHQGKRSIGNSELLAIWEKMEHLITTGEIQEIIQGEDAIDNPLPVFTYDEQYRIIESVTDEYGWPNTDIRGQLMYDNTWFPTEKEALLKALSDCEARIAWLSDIWETKRKELAELKERIETARRSRSRLIILVKELT